LDSIVLIEKVVLKIAYNEFYVQPLPDGHRFPMEKYDLLPKQLLYEGTVEEDAFFSPQLIDQRQVLSVHDPHYFQQLVDLKLTPREQRKTGFPHNERLISREQIIMEGTRKCAEYALKNGVAMNIAGGTHHAFSNRGEGFCLLNDIAIATNWLLDQQKAEKVLIVDLDVHQGNGTAEIFSKNPNVFTFSMHGKNNYPLYKEQSNIDVELDDGTNDSTYLYLLEKNLDEILSDFDPNFIFFQSGVDIISTDKLGRLNVSIQGCKKRDEIVFEIAKKNKIPIVASMGGGYSPEIKHIIEAHANTFRTAQHIFF
jgi:acetoin utilization deacetylase AcuC-like enzyme